MPDVKKFGDDVVEAMGDMSQREVIDRMADHGVRVSQGMISNMRMDIYSHYIPSMGTEAVKELDSYFE